MNTSSEDKQNHKDARWVVLFDIDGTLVEGPSRGMSAGARAMMRATAELTGMTDPPKTIDFGGRTDPEIARLLLEAAGESGPGPERIGLLLDHYVRYLKEGILTLPYRALGSPRAAVAGLAREGAVIGLGTGNLRAGGTAKLRSAGILDLFDMALGGFGDDGEVRSEVLSRGVKRCDPTCALPVFIVGDTHRDVSAAHQIGAKCIGVPFRQSSREVLLEAGADAVVDLLDHTLVQVVRELDESG